MHMRQSMPRAQLGSGALRYTGHLVNRQPANVAVPCFFALPPIFCCFALSTIFSKIGDGMARELRVRHFRVAGLSPICVG